MTIAIDERRRWYERLDERAEIHVKVIEFKAKKLQREQIYRDQKERIAQLAELQSNRELARRAMVTADQIASPKPRKSQIAWGWYVRAVLIAAAMGAAAIWLMSGKLP